MTHAHSGLRRSVSSLATLALAAGATAVLATPAPAQAATTSITSAELRWELNSESTGGAFAPGTWNLFSAGRLDDPGAGGQTLRAADQGATWANGATAGWSSSDGNVTIEDKLASGGYAPTTWAGTRTSSTGATTNTGATLSENVVSIANGTGTVDPVTDTGTISWDGDFTVVYYSGMSFFYVSDPELSVTNGTGKLTATLSGYGSDMDDPTAWSALPATEVTLADLTGVDLTTSGFTVTPRYLGVTVTPPAGSSPQSTATPATAGSFPQSFVDFQGLVGTASYWYSSGGSVDARKLTTPLNVTWAPRVTVSRTTLLADGSHQVTVEGTGFDPSLATGTRPPLAGQQAGAYVVFGKFAQGWRPSAGAAAATRVNTSQKWAVPAASMSAIGGEAGGAVELRPDGSFTATVTVDKTAIDAAVAARPNPADLVNYGIYTYPGSGATQALYETYTPITFIGSAATLAVTAADVDYGDDQVVSVAVTGTGTVGGTVTLHDGSTVLGRSAVDAGKATFRLRKPTAGTRTLTASYSGDASHAGVAQTATATVAKALPTLTVEAQDVTAGQPVEVTVQLPAAATGPVTLTEGATALGEADLVDGTATFTVAHLATGAHTLVATYAGDTNHEAAAASKVVTVAAAPVQPTPTPTPTATPTPTTPAPESGTADEPVKGRAKVTWGTRPTAGRKGTAVVKVSGLATGKITAVLRTVSKTGTSSKVTTITARIKGGVAKVRLPRLGKGKYALVVKVPGNDDVAKARVTRTFRVA
ncbi:Ig-like domain (group 3) [Nocardioides exalbidus]|uniref:Ig-like domain (Group 3) n=1 Tax=Nocardioides exalbidus TaxID=402596 RepID=A0A1H4TS37_9ACTN|nr:Ig-like domain-containing protein [Nocardioides exalbidus]SEC58874.1 Ig-like domain (group 3) [Nocardioides exalbidus]